MHHVVFVDFYLEKVYILNMMLGGNINIIEIYGSMGFILFCVSVTSIVCSHYFFLLKQNKIDLGLRIVAYVSLLLIFFFSGIKLGIISFLVIWVASYFGAFTAKIFLTGRS